MATLPISEFLTERLLEFDPTFELRSGTGFEQLFFKPLQFIVQPLRDEADQMQIAQSFRRILNQDDPDAFDEESVDDIGSNLFVDRNTGDFSAGVARVSYDEPVDREFPAGGAVFVGNNGLNYINPEPFSITSAQMGAQVSEGLFYFDIPVRSEDRGGDTELDVGGLVSLLNDPDAISVTNLSKLVGGLDRETNTEYIERVQNSIAVRDLVVGKGFNAILFENFAGLITELQPIGMGDEEMMRDIVFNTHIGGKIDGYFKAPTVQVGFKNFVGLLIDTTRQVRTAANLPLESDPVFMGFPNISRTGGKDPIVREVKVETAAEYVSTVDLSSPIDLSANRRIKITIDGTVKEFNLSGVSPSSTSRNEIIQNINFAFGIDVAFSSGNSIRLRSPTDGLDSEIVLENPSVMLNGSALLEVFGLSEPGPHVFVGDGPIVLVETTHYTIDDTDGEITRVVGANILGSNVTPITTGVSVDDSDTFTDPTAGIFLSVVVNDILTITAGPDAGDYRILEKPDNNTLIIDAELTANSSAVNYYIHRTGIKNGEIVFIEYHFNPVSIDVGDLVKLDPDGKTRGIRPGRDAFTITDTAFLRIRSIELIDPVTTEPIGEILEGSGGYGLGPFGLGPFGIGASGDYFLIVNEPTARFSAFEDSLIVLRSSFQGFSIRVSYDYSPVKDFHNFVRSETERVLDGDVLMKHFIPAYVKGTIRYRVDETDTSVPDNETLQQSVRDFISARKSNTELEFSDIIQFIVRETDPFDRYGSFVEQPISLRAEIHNTNGGITVVEGTNKLTVPKEDPFPKDTPRPLTPRIAHWLADDLEDGLVLERITDES